MSRVTSVRYDKADGGVSDVILIDVECGHNIARCSRRRKIPTVGENIYCNTCVRDQRAEQAKVIAEKRAAQASIAERSDYPHTHAGVLPKKNTCDAGTARKWFGRCVREAGLENALAVLMSYGCQHTDQLSEDPRYYARACDRFLKAWAERTESPLLAKVKAKSREVYDTCGWRMHKNMFERMKLENLRDLSTHDYQGFVDECERQIAAVVPPPTEEDVQKAIKKLIAIGGNRCFAEVKKHFGLRRMKDFTPDKYAKLIEFIDELTGIKLAEGYGACPNDPMPRRRPWEMRVNCPFCERQPEAKFCVECGHKLC